MSLTQWNPLIESILAVGTLERSDVERRRGHALFFSELCTMAEGTIKRLTDKGFGFIDNGTGKDMFFHMSNLEGVSYDELQEGQQVSYTEGHGPKGPRAENVRLV